MNYVLIKAFIYGLTIGILVTIIIYDIKFAKLKKVVKESIDKLLKEIKEESIPLEKEEDMEFL